MSDWIVGLESSAEGARIAALLALTSAVAHAFFGALQKGRHDPWLARGAIDLWLVIFSAPIALFLVPWPAPHLWPIFAGAVALHFAYKLTMAMAYDRAPYTVVYPVVRGTGPMITVAVAAVVFSESYTAMQWLGVGCLSFGILALSRFNLKGPVPDRALLRAGIFWALACGVLTAAYTTFDAWGIRQSPDPFTFLAWFFLLTAFDFPVIAWARWRRMPDRPTLAPLMARGALGALVAYVSFGGVMLATRIDKVGEAAVLRETSTVFAALIGWAVLGEKVGPRRLALMALIAAGAVIVEFAGR